MSPKAAAAATAAATRLVDIVGELPGEVKGYLWSAGMAGLDSVPAGVVQLPTLVRTGVDQPEDHLGQLDLPLTFDVVFYFDYSNVDYSAPQALEVAGAFIDAVDDDITLGGTVTEAKVVRTEPQNVESDGARPLFAYLASVEVLLFL